MQLLEIIQRVMRSLPLSPIASAVVGSSDPTVLQLLEMLQSEGDDLVSRHEWAPLIALHSFAASGVDPQSATLPSDWSRLLVDASYWRSGSKLTPLSGPAPSDIWHRLLSMPGVRFPGYWRMYGGAVQIIGVPSGETVTGEYISNKWILASDGTTTKQFFSADDDTPKLPERLLRLGLIWRWKQSKGLDYAEDLRNAELELERAIAADRSTKSISTRWQMRPEVPVYSWPGVITPT